jgi:2-methylisocitrate lyase-like PEP mutase family enzyme
MKEGENMKSLTSRKTFRELVSGPRFIIALGIWDPYTARVAESLGIGCVHLGGYQFGVHRVTSEPLTTLTELTDASRSITSAVGIPLVVDAGAGFGEPLHVMRTVKELERAGVAALHIEDQIYPKRAHYHKGIEHIIPRQEMVAKIKAAVAARTDPDTVIIGRTDAMSTDGFAEGVERANLYLAAGAEMVMVFPNTVEEAKRAPREIKGPVCYTNGEGNQWRRPVFTVKQFEDMGYKLGTYPRSLLCPVTQEMKRVITNLLTKGETGLPEDKMFLWRQEVEDLIGLDEYYKIESTTVEHGSIGGKEGQ